MQREKLKKIIIPLKCNIIKNYVLYYIRIMSQIITIPEAVICDFCKAEMIKIQVGRYKCLCCGAKEDNY